MYILHSYVYLCVYTYIYIYMYIYTLLSVRSAQVRAYDKKGQCRNLGIPYRRAYSLSSYAPYLCSSDSGPWKLSGRFRYVSVGHVSVAFPTLFPKVEMFPSLMFNVSDNYYYYYYCYDTNNGSYTFPGPTKDIA